MVTPLAVPLALKLKMNNAPGVHDGDLLRKFYDVCNLYSRLSSEPVTLEGKVCYISEILTGDEPGISKAFVAYAEDDEIVIAFARMWMRPDGSDIVCSMTVVLRRNLVVMAAESFRLFAMGLNAWG